MTDANGKTKKVATTANEDSWRNNMGDVIIDQDRTKQILGGQVDQFDPNNYPKVGTDHITTDQKQLDYCRAAWTWMPRGPMPSGRSFRTTTRPTSAVMSTSST